MPIKIAQRPTIKTIVLNILFYLSLLLVLISVSSFFILDYYENKYSQTLNDLETTLNKEKTSEEATLKKEISEYQKKINDFSSLVDSRKNLANFLPFIEKNTHPKVQWTELSLNLEDFKVVLSGTADGFQTLGQQISIFKKEELINDFSMSGISMGEKGEVGFGFNFSLSSEIFK